MSIKQRLKCCCLRGVSGSARVSCTRRAVQQSVSRKASKYIEMCNLFRDVILQFLYVLVPFLSVGTYFFPLVSIWAQI